MGSAGLRSDLDRRRARSARGKEAGDGRQQAGAEAEAGRQAGAMQAVRQASNLYKAGGEGHVGSSSGGWFGYDWIKLDEPMVTGGGHASTASATIERMVRNGISLARCSSYMGCGASHSPSLRTLKAAVHT